MLTIDEKDWSDHKAIRKLLQSIEVKSQIKIVNSAELNNLINLFPKIMNHNTLRREEYDPFNISTQLEKKSQDEHKEFINAYNT